VVGDDGWLGLDEGLSSLPPLLAGVEGDDGLDGAVAVAARRSGRLLSQWVALKPHAFTRSLQE
jgi:hypothetical protein